MGRRSPISKKSSLPDVSLGKVVEEDLPFPVVHYPKHYGTFFAFSEQRSGQAVLCDCSRSAIKNLIRLKEMSPEAQNVDARRRTLLESCFFPDSIAETIKQSGPDVLNQIRFEPGLCHRCNLIPPTLRYCHEMYGTKFIQHFGWYVNQRYLKLGINPKSLTYLRNLCPQVYQDKIELANAATLEFKSEERRLMKVARGPERLSAPREEPSYWANFNENEVQSMISLRRNAEQIRRAFTKRIENSVRRAFGFKDVGEGWVSETLLFQIVSRLFSGYDVLRHHRPKWLNGLELDTYIPNLGVALEYQGQRHFHPVKAWGGDQALDQLVERDIRKAKICEHLGITLISVDFTEPITEEYVRFVIKDHSIDISSGVCADAAQVRAIEAEVG